MDAAVPNGPIQVRNELLRPQEATVIPLSEAPRRTTPKKRAAEAAPSAEEQVSLALRILLAALTGLLAATLLSALTRVLLLLARLWVALRRRAVRPGSVGFHLDLVHDISFCCGGSRIGYNAVSQQLSPRSANFADADLLSGFRVPVDFSLSQLR